MTTALDFLSVGAGLATIVGLGQGVLGYAAVRRFRARLGRTARVERPPMTILKPLCGDEPLLEAALASVCAVDYPSVQIVFGVQDANDPAIAVVERLRRRFPKRELTLVVDPALHGANRKIGNLINMLPAARHDVLVIGDSDVHVAPDYLDRIAVELARPNTGLVTTLYAGLPGNASLAATLGATGLTHGFLPGALLARALGRQDALGVTMALRRETLEAVGGLPALVDHLADDHMLGRLVHEQGLQVRLASALTATTVPERRFGALFRHELRWARTVLSLVPGAFLLSAVQFPLFWAALAVIGAGAADWSLALLLGGWLVRALCAIGIDRALGLTRTGLASAPPVWLLPLRDLMSIAVMVASLCGDRVEWRGRTMRVGGPIGTEPGFAAESVLARAVSAPLSPALPDDVERELADAAAD